MSGASIETTLELWASSLRDVKVRMRGLFTQGGLFTQERVAASAGLFLDGLLGDERRKTGRVGDKQGFFRARLRSLAWHHEPYRLLVNPKPPDNRHFARTACS